ncbi:hypothetical protein AN641_09350 [Candidatus Epulonipiscioides gigas]|nr:hypothetical protein AN641_09350 [Epulopiscium sp. SCG-C07WGA-EpuloA2]
MTANIYATLATSSIHIGEERPLQDLPQFKKKLNEASQKVGAVEKVDETQKADEQNLSKNAQDAYQRMRSQVNLFKQY